MACDASARPGRRLDAFILALAIGLRLLLALVNREANDDHLSLARVIAEERRIPGVRDVGQGVQPKLYHLTIAVLWEALGVRSDEHRRIVAQLASCAAGVGTVLVARAFLKAVPATAAARRLAFAVVALNPSLVGIAAQATNDAFVIFFVALAVFAAQRFLLRPSASRWALLTATSLLAPLAKGNGLVVLPALAAGLGASLAAARRREEPAARRRLLLTASVGWAVVAALALATLFPFRDHYRLFRLPFVDRTALAGGMGAAADAFLPRPGVRSIPDALLTFRIVDLIEQPWIENGVAATPLSRTSLWSTLYGRFHFSRYPSWPPSWRANGDLDRVVGRAAFVLGLPAAALLAAAIVGRGARWLALVAVPAERRPPSPLTTLNDAVIAGYLAFVVVFALAYRDFSFMKDIFALPAVLGFAAVFAQALSGLARRRAGYARLVSSASTALLVVYVVDVGTLASQLAQRRNEPSLARPARAAVGPLTALAPPAPHPA